MNTTILYDTISYIPYIYQVPSTPPTTYQFPIEPRKNIYMVAKENEYPSLASNYFELIWGGSSYLFTTYVAFWLATAL